MNFLRDMYQAIKNRFVPPPMPLPTIKPVERVKEPSANPVERLKRVARRVVRCRCHDIGGASATIGCSCGMTRMKGVKRLGWCKIHRCYYCLYCGAPDRQRSYNRAFARSI